MQYFYHERLAVYRLAVEVAEAVLDLPKGAGPKSLIEQAQRAATSVPMNIAEGVGQQGSPRRAIQPLSIAKGSAAELCAALALLRIHNRTELQAKTRSVGAMLTQMIRTWH